MVPNNYQKWYQCLNMVPGCLNMVPRCLNMVPRCLNMVPWCLNMVLVCLVKWLQKKESFIWKASRCQNRKVKAESEQSGGLHPSTLPLFLQFEVAKAAKIAILQNRHILENWQNLRPGSDQIDKNAAELSILFLSLTPQNYQKATFW